MMGQLLAHLWGDYLLQSDWMALNKRKSSAAAWAHALAYSFPFLLLTGKAPSPAIAGTVILVTHFLIDRFGLARYVVYAKNFLAPSRRYYPWAQCVETGYEKNRPAWLTVWLLIIADNTLHLTCNYIALKFL